MSKFNVPFHNVVAICEVGKLDPYYNAALDNIADSIDLANLATNSN